MEEKEEKIRDLYQELELHSHEEVHVHTCNEAPESTSIAKRIGMFTHNFNPALKLINATCKWS